MTKTTAVNPGLLDWLSSGDCLPWLRNQARLILKQAGELGLPASLWPYPRPNQAPAEELGTAMEEVAHEFWLFMRTALERRSEDLPPELVGGGARPGLLGVYFRNGFLYQLRSQVRRKEVSLYHYLYRRVRETVSQSPDIFHRNGRWGMLYSLEPEGEQVTTLLGLIDTAYTHWPSPARLISERALQRFRLEDLRTLAGFFWREATGRIARPCFLPCRELVAYLAEHYQCLSTGGALSQDALPEAMAEAGELAQVDPSGLEVLAAQLLPLWSPVRRQIFGLALDPGNLTLQDVAQRAGLSGPSHAKYHLDRACEDITNFCETWPGVVPPPTDRSFWTEFLHCVVAACKSSLPDRSKEQ